MLHTVSVKSCIILNIFWNNMILKYIIANPITSALIFPLQRKLLIATSLIVAVSLFMVMANYSEKPYFRLQPILRQGFSSNWMFSKQPYKGFKPHLGYVSIPKQEVRDSLKHSQTKGKLHFWPVSFDIMWFSIYFYVVYLTVYLYSACLAFYSSVGYNFLADWTKICWATLTSNSSSYYEWW